MDKLMILGASGFTGTHLLNYIEKNDLAANYLFVGANLKSDRSSNISFRKIDLLNSGQLDSLMASEYPDYVLNFVGTYDRNDFDFMLQLNANISRNICESIIKNKIPVKKVLFIGSAAEYGQVAHLPVAEKETPKPVNSYGLTKLIQTQYINYYFNNYHLNLNIARTFNIIGQGVSPSLSIGAFIKQIRDAKDGDTISVGNINTKRDFIDVEDAIDAYWKILFKGKVGEIYNVCSGKSYYIKDILKFLIDKSEKRLKISVKDELIKKNDIVDIYGDNSKLIRDTGWKWRIEILDSLRKLFD